MELQGKVAVVTGGSRGIGKAIAKTFAREGAHVVVNYVQASAEASRVVEEIRMAGGSAISVMAEVSQRVQAQKLVDEAVKTFGRLDVLVNNAGIRSEGTILDTTEEDWDRTMDVNLKGPFNCMQAAGKVMVQQRYGKIVNISSISGLGGAPGGELAYSCSKAGLISMTLVASLDLGQYGINVNCVAPGWTVTDMVLRAAGSEKRLDELKQIKARMASMGRVGGSSGHSQRSPVSGLRRVELHLRTGHRGGRRTEGLHESRMMARAFHSSLRYITIRDN